MPTQQPRLGGGTVWTATAAAAAASSVQRQAAASASSATEGLVVLTREAGKNDKLRERLKAQQINVLELPCIAHCHAEGHGQLQQTLETVAFDYVVITSPEVTSSLFICLSGMGGGRQERRDGGWSC